MTEFGVYPNRESAIYTIPVEAHTVPLSIHISVPASGSRDFVFVPDAVTAQWFPDAFASYGRSDALGSIFRYVSANRNVIPLAGAEWIPSPHRTSIRFALARWIPSSTVPLPETVHCIQRLALGAQGHELHEIVPSTRDAAAEGVRQ